MIRYLLFIISFTYIAINSSICQSQEIVPGIYKASGSCNTYLIKTERGYVLIDPGSEGNPVSDWLKPVRDSIKAVLLTHGHPDHTVFIKEWRDLNVPIYVNSEFIEFQHYNARLDDFFSIRNSIQGAPNIKGRLNNSRGNYAAIIIPDHFFNDFDTLVIGNTHFIMIHTGGETPDQSLIWIPEKKAAFVGDNYYTSFPNIFTLRGTKPRWALEYVRSNDLVIKSGAEVLFPGHGEPITGKEEVKMNVAKYRDAILYVHDATVKGMNEGKDVFTLMKEIQLPDSLKIPEFFGRVSWSVRGIYEGYVGWFDVNISHMYPFAPHEIYNDIVELAGGVEKIISRSRILFDKGELLPALTLLDIVLHNDAKNLDALQIRKQILEKLRSESSNAIENAWLDYEINRIKPSFRAVQKPEIP